MKIVSSLLRFYTERFFHFERIQATVIWPIQAYVDNIIFTLETRLCVKLLKAICCLHVSMIYIHSYYNDFSVYLFLFCFIL